MQQLNRRQIGSGSHTYLDTSTVLAAGKHRLDAMPAALQRAGLPPPATSFLTLMELIAGARDRDASSREVACFDAAKPSDLDYKFRRHRAAIVNLFASGIPIDARPPEYMSIEHFRLTRSLALPPASETVEMEQLVEVIVGPYDSRQDFREACQQAGLLLALNKFVDHHEKAGSQFAENHRQLALDMQNAGKDAITEELGIEGGPSDGGDFFEAAISRLARKRVREELAKYPFYLEAVFGLWRLCLGLVCRIGHPPPDPSDLFASYDKGTATYHKAYGWKIHEIHVRGNQPRKRNDGLDLQHCLYIRTGDVLLSEDSELRKMALGIGIDAIDLASVGPSANSVVSEK